MLGEIISGIGSLVGGFFQQDAAQDAFKATKDLAQHTIRDRVRDANKAGIHPLAALGVNPVSLAPAQVGDLGIGAASESLGRAVSAGSTGDQRAATLGYEIAKAQLDGALIDNDIKRAELASRIRRTLTGAGVPPVIPAVEANTARGGDISGQVLPLPFGLGNWHLRPKATAEEIERQWGDLGQEVYGAGAFADDAFYNIVTRRLPQFRENMSEWFGINLD